MKRVPELTGLRCLAIFMVLLSHGSGTLAKDVRRWLTPFRLTDYGDLGVQIFFVLSGFLITSILQAEFRAHGRIDFYDFYRRRALRIWPASYAFIAVLGLLSASGMVDIGWQHFAAAALQIWNYAAAIGLGPPPGLHADGNWYLAHFWSLSLEEQFYWIWPPVLLLLLRRRFVACLPWLILCIPLVRIATYFLAPQLRGQLGMMLHTGVDAILIGCYVALRHESIEAFILSRRHPLAWINFALAVLMLATPQLQGRFGGYWSATFGPTVTAALTGLLIVGVAARPGYWLSRLLRTRAFVFVGLISYSLYLWQQLFLYTPSPVAFAFPWNLLQVVSAACLSYWLIELPFLRLKDHRAGPSAPSTGIAEPSVRQ